MSEIKKELFYTKDHEWVKKLGPATVLVGITDFAQRSLGDVTYLQLPAVGHTFKRGDVLGSVESVKAVSDIYAPLSGKVTKINDALVNDPGPLNTDPYGQAWLMEVESNTDSEFAQLLPAIRPTNQNEW